MPAVEEPAMTDDQRDRRDDWPSEMRAPEPEQPTTPADTCVDCGAVISVCEHALKRVFDVTNVLGREQPEPDEPAREVNEMPHSCACASTAPTYPTYRADPHLPACPWRKVDDTALALDSILRGLREVLPPARYAEAERRMRAHVASTGDGERVY
jgi:hypothetical protein